MSGNGSKKDAHSSKRSLFVIANGKKAGSEELREAVFDLRDKGHDVQVRVTYESSDTERYVQEALAHKADTIVAAGGDGSVNETAAALVAQGAPEKTAFAVVPLGTANDFATGLQIPQDPRDALLLAASDTASPIDVGTVNDETFVNVATGGFGAEVTEATDTGMKNSLGGAAYILTGLMKPHTISAKDALCHVPLDAMVKQDEKWVPIKGLDHSEIKAARNGSQDYAEFEGKLLVLAVGNSRQAGGGVQLCPDAQVDDGMLDVTYIINPELAQARHHPWRRGLKWLLQRAAVSTILIPMQLSVPYLAFSVVYQIPTILGDLQNDKRLDGPKGQIRCSWLEVECPDELQINRDGEPMRAKKYKFEILPQRLAVHVPSSDLFSKSNGKASPRAQQRQQLSQRIEARQQKREAHPVKQVADHHVSRMVLKTSLLIGLGVGIGAKLQQQRPIFK